MYVSRKRDSKTNCRSMRDVEGLDECINRGEEAQVRGRNEAESYDEEGRGETKGRLWGCVVMSRNSKRT